MPDEKVSYFTNMQYATIETQKQSDDSNHINCNIIFDLNNYLSSVIMKQKIISKKYVFLCIALAGHWPPTQKQKLYIINDVSLSDY